jgi:hypothetical protein
MILARSGVMVPAHDAPAIVSGAVAVSDRTIAALGTGAYVYTVMVNGQLVVEDGKVLSLD